MSDPLSLNRADLPRHGHFVLSGGRVVDPARGVDVLADVAVSGGRIVERAAPEAQRIDASGCVVMAGGIDLHSHIGGGKVNLARLMLPESLTVH